MTMTMDNILALGAKAGALLKARGETVAVAESSTGGLISAALLSVPGASAYFIGGGVIYTRQARSAFLQLPDEAMRGMRGASEAYALLSARTARERCGTVWGVGETGATGPAGNRYGDAAGHSCIAAVGARERVVTLETGNPDRVANMYAFTAAALDLLIECLA
jgi:nicotinamide-nucleotide amidase